MFEPTSTGNIVHDGPRSSWSSVAPRLSRCLSHHSAHQELRELSQSTSLKCLGLSYENSALSVAFQNEKSGKRYTVSMLSTDTTVEVDGNEALKSTSTNPTYERVNSSPDRLAFHFSRLHDDLKGKLRELKTEVQVLQQVDSQPKAVEKIHEQVDLLQTVFSEFDGTFREIFQIELLKTALVTDEDGSAGQVPVATVSESPYVEVRSSPQLDLQSQNNIANGCIRQSVTTYNESTLDYYDDLLLSARTECEILRRSIADLNVQCVKLAQSATRSEEAVRKLLQENEALVKANNSLHHQINTLQFELDQTLGDLRSTTAHNTQVSRQLLVVNIRQLAAEVDSNVRVQNLQLLLQAAQSRVQALENEIAAARSRSSLSSVHTRTLVSEVALRMLIMLSQIVSGYRFITTLLDSQVANCVFDQIASSSADDNDNTNHNTDSGSA